MVVDRNITFNLPILLTENEYPMIIDSPHYYVII
jgi:hypothetical protein